MKHWRLWLLTWALSSAAMAQTAQQAVITNHTKVVFLGDSYFSRGLGERFNISVGSFFINYYPQYFNSWRDHSRSGQGVLGFKQEELPYYCIPDAGATYGKTNWLLLTITSGNGGPNSNQIYTNIAVMLQFPTNSFVTNPATGALYLTNDWPQAHAADLFKTIVLGDTPYYASAGGNKWTYSDGGRSAALESGAAYVDSFRNLSNGVTSYRGGYPANSNLFFDNPNGGGVPQYDHNGNWIQGAWAMTSLVNATNAGGLGVDTNTFTFVLDAAAASISSTSHCVISGLTGNSSGVSFTLHADRMAPGMWRPGIGPTTNDMTGCTNLIPGLVNAFCEIVRITNLVAGNYQVTWDGTNSYTRTADQLAAGDNGFLNPNTPLAYQRANVLYDLGLMMNVSPTNQSEFLAGNGLIGTFESGARALWPTNAPSVSDYISKMIGTPLNLTTPKYAQEDPLIAQDLVVHADAQQNDHTISVVRMQQATAQTLTTGTVHWGQ